MHVHPSALNYAYCVMYVLFSQDTTASHKQNVRPNRDQTHDAELWVWFIVGPSIYLWLVLHVFHLPRLRQLSPEYYWKGACQKDAVTMVDFLLKPGQFDLQQFKFL